LKEKQFSPSDDKKGVLERQTNRQMRETVQFSTDPRDFGYIAENVPCQNACPARTNIPGYIRFIHEKRYGRAYELNRLANILPGVLGRICSRPCEEVCRHGETGLGTPVNICHLKRSAADLKPNWHMIKEELYAPSGKTVAVIGAGPAGLAAAHELVILGHSVTMYEAQAKPGGMLMYGIPEFRLPRDILELEMNNILRLGIDLKTGVAVGRDIMLSELLKKYDAVIATAGCQAPARINLTGKNLEGVYNGLDFVMQINQGKSVTVGNRVAVIGGGYTAIDCARLAARLGASEVTVNLRKTEEFMRIDEHEKYEAKLEGINFVGLVQPKSINGKDGVVESLTFERTRLVYADDGVGRKAVAIENSEFTRQLDTVILAVGQTPDTGFIDKNITLDGDRIFTKPGFHRTNVNRFFSAGDCVNGSTNVITAIADGRMAAHEIDELFSGQKRHQNMVRFESSPVKDRKRSDDFIPASEMPGLALSKRMRNMSQEVELGYDEAISQEESKRCYLCNLKFEIDKDRCIYCSYCIDVMPRDCIKLVTGVGLKKDGSFGDLVETKSWRDTVAIEIDNKRCIRCGMCYEVCPMNCISISKVELIEKKLEA
jgi:NADPH-dependent glutamate synthase beta subunit-like oxidoreductase/ferredoxin